MPPRYQSTALTFEEKARNLFDHFGQPAHRGHARVNGGAQSLGSGQSLIQIPNTRPASEGAGQLLALKATGDSIAADGDNVTFAEVIDVRGFDSVPVAGAVASWVHPISAVYALAYVHTWDSYTGGGSIDLLLDGTIERNIVAGTEGQQSIDVIGYYAEAGQLGAIKVTHDDASAQTCDAILQVMVTDPYEATASDEWTKVSSADVYELTRADTTWWTTEGQSGVTVSRRDAVWSAVATFEASEVIETGVERVRGVAYDGSHLWVTGAADVLAKYATDGTLSTSFALTGESHNGVAFDGTDLWVVEGAYALLYRYNTAGTLQQTITLPAGTYYGLAWWDSALWVLNASDQLLKVETDGDVVDVVDVSGAVADPTGVHIAPDGTLYVSKDGAGIYQRTRRLTAATTETGAPAAWGGGDLIVYGHSYTIPPNDDASSNWPEDLAASLPATLSARGVGGDVAQETVVREMFEGTTVTAWTPGTAGTVFIEAMLNDVRRVGTGTNAVDRWSDIIETAVHFARAGTFQDDDGAAVTKVGTWSSNVGTNRVGGAVANTNTDGDYYEIDFDGDAITILTLTFRAGGGVTGETTFTDASDGTILTTHNCDPTGGMPANYPQSWTITPIHLSGFGAGSHTVRGTKTGGTTIYLDGFLVPATSPPNVVLVKDHELPQWTTGANAAPWNQGGDAAVTAYQAALDAIAATFPTGEVVTADAASWDPATMVGSDDVHPNDLGVAAYTNGVADALDGLA